MKLNKELAEYIAGFMNDLLKQDPVAISCLVTNRSQCNTKLSKHPSVQTTKIGNHYYVGILGILNGLCGTREGNNGSIFIEYDDNTTTNEPIKINEFKCIFD
jgi:hypothetical protein